METTTKVRVNDYKSIVAILWLTIFSHAMWFFGNLYEQITDVPNMFGPSPTASKLMWTDYHSVTDPRYYYIFIIGVLAIVLLWFYRKQLSPYQVRNLLIATLASLVAVIITVIAVTQINNRLFFGEPIADQKVVINLATSWVALNFVRLLFLMVCIINLIKIFNINLDKK